MTRRRLPTSTVFIFAIFGMNMYNDQAPIPCNPLTIVIAIVTRSGVNY